MKYLLSEIFLLFYRNDFSQMLQFFVLRIDTNILVIVGSLMTWKARHSLRAKPEGYGEFPRSLMSPQIPKFEVLISILLMWNETNDE